MERVADLAAHFKVPAMACINKSDLNPEQSERIEQLAADKGIEILGRIPFDPVFIKSMVQGQNVIEYSPDSEIAGAIRRMWERIIRLPLMQST